MKTHSRRSGIVIERTEPLQGLGTLRGAKPFDLLALVILMIVVLLLTSGSVGG